MSRLDSFIRRMCAQRDILNTLPSRIGGIPGPILEFGLGSGRTHDHLREIFPDRRIVVFESVLGIDHAAGLRAEDFVFGDLRETGPRIPSGCAALVHVDIGSGDLSEDHALHAWLPALVARVLAPGGYVASSSPLADPSLVPDELPPTVGAQRYFVLRSRPMPLADPRQPTGG